MPAPTAIENRCRGFKNRDKTSMENFKNRRTAVTVELRKEKRDEQILKKRNVTDLSISPLKENNQQNRHDGRRIGRLKIKIDTHTHVDDK